MCGATDTVSADGGEYIAQNNIWGAETAQCITVDGTSFTVDSAAHDNSTSGAPAAYPSLFKGCHWGQCTTGGGLPVQVDDMPSATSDWTTTVPDSGRGSGIGRRRLVPGHRRGRVRALAGRGGPHDRLVRRRGR